PRGRTLASGSGSAIAKAGERLLVEPDRRPDFVDAFREVEILDVLPAYGRRDTPGQVVGLGLIDDRALQILQDLLARRRVFDQDGLLVDHRVDLRVLHQARVIAAAGRVKLAEEVDVWRNRRVGADRDVVGPFNAHRIGKRGDVGWDSDLRLDTDLGQILL